LGKTGIEISFLSFGSGALAGGYDDVPQQIANEAVKHALEVGINFFDTAPLYSSKDARAEEILGVALKPFPRGSFVLNTKCGTDHINGVRVFDYTAKGIRKSVETSLKRLQVTFVDMVTLHDIEHVEDINVVVTECLPELQKLKDEGVAKSIGISGYPLNVLLHVARRVPVDFVLTYAHYTLQNELLAQHIEAFEALGCGLISASSLCLGFFRPQGPPDFHFACDEMKSLAPQINAICVEHGLNIAKLATKYAVHAPLAKSGRINTTLIGFAKASEVDDALQGLEEFTQIEQDVILKIKAVLKPFHNYTWPSGNEKFKSL